MYFPFNLYYPSRFRNRAIAVIESRFGCTEEDPSLETAVYKSAEETLTLLSRRLGTEPYLFGKSPTSADAVLYAHLVKIHDFSHT
jgi:glutathione S-transferase